mmetsp:Transcript_10441/g.30136  ORF Transcript_10441/g.30136 Transcript_10441/m.30136 type:complete len:465 (+) Transcript_10441:64-1458(+)
MFISRLIGHHTAYGAKSIGSFQSFVFLVNQIFGAGFVGVPLCMLHAGWLTVFFANAAICAISCIATFMVIKSMVRVPGNKHLEKREEYVATVQYFLGDRSATLIQVVYQVAIQAMNIAAIIVTAEAFDRCFIRCFGQVPVIEVWPHAHVGGWSNVEKVYRGGYENHDGRQHTMIFAITGGYLFTALLCLPMSYLNLNENMYIQIVTFFLQFGAIGLIIISSIIRSFQQEERTHSPMTFPPLVGDTGYGAVFGIMVASYSYVVLIPSWCNEVLPSTRVMPVVWMSAILSAFLYFSFALVVCVAYPALNSSNAFVYMTNEPSTGMLTRLSMFSFSFTTVLPGIPVMAIASRYNLYNSGLCGQQGAFFCGCCAPWLVAWALSNRRLFGSVCVSLFLSVCAVLSRQVCWPTTSCPLWCICWLSPARPGHSHSHTHTRKAAQVPETFWCGSSTRRCRPTTTMRAGSPTQ